MSSTERSRRFLERIRGTGASTSLLEAECEKLKDENTKLKMQLAGARHQIRQLTARRPQSSPKPKPPPRAQSEIEQQLRKTVAKLRRRLQEVAHASKSTVYLKQGDLRKLRVGLHPDGVLDPVLAKRVNIASQILNELFDSGRLREIEED